MDRPKRRYEIVIKAGADSLDELKRLLRDEILQLPDGVLRYPVVSGASYGYADVTLELRPEITRETWETEYTAYQNWLDQQFVDLQKGDA